MNLRGCQLAILLVAAAGTMSDVRANDASRVIYQWSAGEFQPRPDDPWKKGSQDGDGVVIQATGEGWNNYISVPAGTLLSGHDYTATAHYRIIAPAKFPDSFYMFARSPKLGQTQDFWYSWNGDVGTTGTAQLTISLQGNKQSDGWLCYLGCKGPGTILLQDFTIVEGRGLNYLRPDATFQGGTEGTLPTGAATFDVEPPGQNGPILSAANFGLTADATVGAVDMTTAAANFRAISAAIAACRQRHASRLDIPKGVYRFASKEAIPFDGLSDLIIEGHGSEFILEQLHTGAPAISVQRCRRLWFRNLTLDWDWGVVPIASLGMMQTVAADRQSCEISFPDLNEEQVAATSKAPWMQLIPMDPVTLTRRSSERFSVTVAAIENLGGGKLRVTFKMPVPLKPGESYCVRHLYYGFDGFKVGSSNHLVFENVTIHTMPGMGWFNTGDMHDWKLVNCKIVRREGSRNPFTTAADGFHVSQSQGDLALQNCEITGTGDDAINIHDNCFQGVQRVDDHTLTLVNCPPGRLRLQAGDRLELFHPNYSPLDYIATVQTVSSSDGSTTVTLAEALPEDLSPLSIVQNRRYETRNVSIQNCSFHDVSGRGILLSAHGASIENCQFRNIAGTAIQLHTEIVGNLWAEGSGASNVVIRGNSFDRSAYEGRYENAVVYAGTKTPVGVTEYPLFHEILIEGNSFTAAFGPAVSLTSARGVSVQNNSVKTDPPDPAATTLAGTFYATHASGLVFRNNIWHSGISGGSLGLYFDPKTTDGISYERNQLTTVAF